MTKIKNLEERFKENEQINNIENQFKTAVCAISRKPLKYHQTKNSKLSSRNLRETIKHREIR